MEEWKDYSEAEDKRQIDESMKKDKHEESSQDSENGELNPLSKSEFFKEGDITETSKLTDEKEELEIIYEPKKQNSEELFSVDQFSSDSPNAQFHN